MKKILFLALAGALLWFFGAAEAAARPSLEPVTTAEVRPVPVADIYFRDFPVVHPAAYASCAYLQFINVYEPRIGRSYAVGAQAWCGGSGEWRVVVGCAKTLGGYAYLTTKGPWTHSYWSVRRCPTQYPYANWANFEYHTTRTSSLRAPVGFTRTPAVQGRSYPSDCFHRKVSYTLDYARGTCGWVPSGASFVEKATCQAPDGHRFAVSGVRQWYAYRDSTAQCPGLAKLVGAYIELGST